MRARARVQCSSSFRANSRQRARTCARRDDKATHAVSQFRNTMPNRMFIINRLPVVEAREALKRFKCSCEELVVQRCVSGTGRWSACVCQSFSTGVSAASHLPSSFSDQRKERLSRCRVLVAWASRTRIRYVLHACVYTGTCRRCERF